jgi:NAD(P)-dependent dehydrogenase (short-subunit alcohol dehydrogenase family)
MAHKVPSGATREEAAVIEGLFSVEGKVALVTGGSRGIGLMIARGLVEAGARVYISSRKADACESVAQELSQYGSCAALTADLASRDAARGLVEALGERESRLDVLVNNAGANWGAPLEEFPESGWDKVMDLNVRSIFFLTRDLLPLLRKEATSEDPARVINIGSIDGITVPLLETYSYSASKAALHHMTAVLARKLAPDITVNAVAPGPFESKMMQATLEQFRGSLEQSIPRRRIGEPEDMAGVVLFLASRAGAYTTGAVIPVDGGLSTCR